MGWCLNHDHPMTYDRKDGFWYCPIFGRPNITTAEKEGKS